MKEGALKELDREVGLERSLVVVSWMLDPSGKVLIVSVVMERVLPEASNTFVVLVVT